MDMKPNLENLDYLFDNNTSFELTDSLYKKKTGLPLPQNSSYLLKKSALAKKCKEKGFSLKLKEKTIYCERNYW